jgi:threonine dehydrogenase-like Zn-dependent dehydrogenase
MKAVIFDGELQFIAEYPDPEPKGGEALVRVMIGHEFVGTVEGVNGSDASLIGKRVVGEINCGCGVCSYCLSGMKNHCSQRKVLGIAGKDGAMAEYLTLPLSNLLPVPENVRDEEAVFTEPLAAAYEILEQLHIRPSSRILVMGDGKLGLLASFALNLTGAEITLLGKHPEKLNIAAGIGVKTLLLRDLTPSRSYDLVVEATGSAAGFGTALQLVRPRGTIVLKSTVAEGREMNLAPVVIDEITVVGSRCGAFRPALAALTAGLIETRPLIAGLFPFERAAEAFARAEEKGALKVIIDFRDPL